MVGHAVIDEGGNLKPLTHGVELGHRTQISQQIFHLLGRAHRRERFGEFIKTTGRHPLL